MRVALVVERLEIGGLPNYVLALARMLDEAECSVIVAHGNAPLPDYLELDNIETCHLPGLTAGEGLAAEEAAASALLAWSPDIVHVHLCSAVGVLDRLLAQRVAMVRIFHDLTTVCLRRGRRRWPGDRCQRPLNWTCVGWGCLLSPPRGGGRLPYVADLPAKFRERDAYRKFGVSIACSTFIAGTLRLNGFDDARIHVIPNFSQFDFATEGLGPPKLPGVAGQDRPFELLFSGQAVKGKGLEVLINALSGVEGNWRLTVLSEGPRLAAARATAHDLGLIDRVRFAGWLPQAETARHYQAADLLVFPSIIDEALPLVGLEAMSFGTPLVGFAVGGIPDYLIDGQTGVLVPTTNAFALRAGLRTAMGDAERVRAWGMQARGMVARRHTRAAHIAAIHKAYAAAGARADNRSTKRNNLAQVMS